MGNNPSTNAKNSTKAIVGGSRLSPGQRQENEYWLSRIRHDRRTFLKIPKRLRNDKGFAMEAIHEFGPWVIKFLSPNLRADKDIVIAAVRGDGMALEYASPNLRRDKNVVCVAVQQNGNALRYTPTEIRSCPTVILAAVRNNGRALRFATWNLTNDKVIVMAAVQQHGFALEYASPELQSDIEVVLKATQTHSNALQFAPESVQYQVDLMLATEQVLLSPWNLFWMCYDYCQEPTCSVFTNCSNPPSVLKNKQDARTFSRHYIMSHSEPSTKTLMWSDTRRYEI